MREGRAVRVLRRARTRGAVVEGKFAAHKNNVVTKICLVARVSHVTSHYFPK